MSTPTTTETTPPDRAEAGAWHQADRPPARADVIPWMRDILRRAVLTLFALPDPDKRFLRISAPRFMLVRDAVESYGWTPAAVVRFHPTPRDVQVYLDALGWMAWYERTQIGGEQAVKLFIAWATGVEWMVLCHKFGASERTARRRIDAVAETIFWYHRDSIVKIFVDSWLECPVICAPSCNASEFVYPAPRDLKPIPSAWIADGEKPSADETIPLVGAAREELVVRLERQNKKRAAKKRHQRAAARRQEGPQGPRTPFP